MNFPASGSDSSPLRGIQAIQENLPWFDSQNHYQTFDEATQQNVPNAVSAVTSGCRKPLEQPVDILLSRSIYPAEDGYLDVVVRLKRETPDGETLPGRLEIRLTDASNQEVERGVISEIPGDQVYFSIRFPTSMEGKRGALHVRWSGPDFEAKAAFEVAKKAGVQREGRVALDIANPLSVAATGVPMTVGVPFPRGGLASVEHLRLVDEAGQEIPLQVKETARWARFGSVRWALCDFVVDLKGSPGKVFLEYGPEIRRKQSPPMPLEPGTGGAFPQIDAGPFRIDAGGIHLGKTDVSLGLDALKGAFVERVDGLQFRGWGHHYVLPQQGPYLMDSAAEIEVEQAGSEKVVLRTSGDYRQNGTGDPFCRYVVRYVIHRNSRLIRIFHTWIFTGDGNRDAIRSMGWRIPFEGLKPVGFLSGFGKGAEWLNDYYLRQEDHNLYRRFAHETPQRKDRRITGDSPVEISRPIRETGQGERAAGVMAASGSGVSLLFGVKDFWQNFPSALMLENSAMTFHQWPKYGAPRRHSINDATLGDVWRLWFAHEGENLSFRLPVELTEGAIYTTESGVEPHFAYGRPDSVNAQGIAKTAEMWLCLSDGAQPDEQAVRLMEALNNEQVRAVVDPGWIMASGVFYEMHPRDPERFPEEERIYELNALKPPLQVERMGVYGKWIYGDLLRAADLDAQTASLYRTFRKAHWGWPYSWVPFARSGDLRFYKFAEAATRMMSDVAFCHYVDDEMRRHFKSLPPRLMWDENQPFREIGWHNRNLIPWAGYWGPSSRLYVDKEDYLWHAYYLTGYERARDVALEWARQTKIERPEMFGRGPITAANNRARWPVNLQKQYIEMYEATFDPWYLAGAHAISEMHSHRLRVEGWRGHPWNTGPREFLRYTGDARAREFYVALSERELDWQDLGWADTLSTLIPSSSYGWRLTGDEKALRRIEGFLEAAKWATFTGQEPRHYQGYTVLGQGEKDMLFTSFYQQWFPYLLGTLQAAGRRAENPIPPTFVQKLGKGARIIVEKEAGKPVELRLPASCVIKGPGGEDFIEVPEPASSKGSVTIPANAPAGAYIVRFNAPISLKVPVTEPGTREVVFFGEGAPVETAGGFVQHCFFVPPGTKSFRLELEEMPLDGQSARQVVVWNPEGKEAWAFRQTAAEKSSRQKREALLEVPSGMDGKVWRISQPAKTSLRFTVDPALPRLFSHSADRWFAAPKESLE